MLDIGLLRSNQTEARLDDPVNGLKLIF